MLDSTTWQEQLDAMTPEQKAHLATNDHLLPVSPLNDGDWLVLDRERPAQTKVGKIMENFGPYILTVDGKVQSVYYHYNHHHLMTAVPCSCATCR